ncbi:Uncharacterised protein [Vibrio cholerae]|nr:Uncharacterised protein [Vibrio cholerae]
MQCAKISVWHLPPISSSRRWLSVGAERARRIKLRMVFLIRCHSKCGIVAKRAELDQSFMLPYCESRDS